MVNVACHIRGVTKPNLTSQMERVLISMCSVPREMVSDGKGSLDQSVSFLTQTVLEV